MGIIDFIKNKVNRNNTDGRGVDDSEYQDNYDYFTNSTCPNCQFQLKQVEKKGSCPSCKEAIVNERHFDSKKKMLLTVEQAEKLAIEKKHYHDLKWAIQLAEVLELSQREISAMVKSTQVGTKFSVLWVKANDMAIRYANNSKWLSFRNTRLSMGDIAYRDGHLERALGFYLAVCFIDLNGPDDEESFDLQRASLRQSVLQSIREITKELSIEKDALKDLYISKSTPEKNRFMPLTPEETWDTFLSEYIKKQ